MTRWLTEDDSQENQVSSSSVKIGSEGLDQRIKENMLGEYLGGEVEGDAYKKRKKRDVEGIFL